MKRTYYQNGEYRCPRCGGVMIPRCNENEWECSDCDILGYETWDESTKTGYIDVDIEAWEKYLKESREEDEAWMREQIAEYEIQQKKDQ